MKFLQFVYEDKLSEILHELSEMSSFEIDEFGSFLYDEFFNNIQDEDDDEIFDLSDVEEMIEALGPVMYDFILELLEYTEEEMEESVSRILKKSNINRKKRSFMSNSKADLRKSKVERNKKNRSSRVDRKRYYRANKKKIQSYQKSRNASIKAGQHKVKLRHNE